MVAPWKFDQLREEWKDGEGFWEDIDDVGRRRIVVQKDGDSWAALEITGPTEGWRAMRQAQEHAIRTEKGLRRKVRRVFGIQP
jgi:hypothetical protein